MSKYQVVDPSQAVNDLNEMEFSTLATFNNGPLGVFWSEAGGPGPWEMHPDSDEILHVIEGRIEIEICPEDKSQPFDKVQVGSGSYLVVPKGLWHRHTMMAKTKEMYLSPSNTLHSHEPDPR